MNFRRKLVSSVLYSSSARLDASSLFPSSAFSSSSPQETQAFQSSRITIPCGLCTFPVHFEHIEQQRFVSSTLSRPSVTFLQLTSVPFNHLIGAGTKRTNIDTVPEASSSGEEPSSDESEAGSLPSIFFRSIRRVLTFFLFLPPFRSSSSQETQAIKQNRSFFFRRRGTVSVQLEKQPSVLNFPPLRPRLKLTMSLSFVVSQILSSQLLF